MTDASPVMKGGCQCGAVRYALMSEPTEASICHCRMCQKAFGSYFAPLTGVPKADLVWTKGSLSTFRSSEAVARGFCQACGTPLTYDVLEEDRICVSIGSLDEPARIKPEVQWGIEGKLPAFDTLHLLRAEKTGMPSEMLPKLKSRQHPDHD
ncbi:GFA family protein [Microvirga pudoricolor]|uniref:GFA family protein n=1 Tax=Microvirga pudoricolor TaxID=2778729 RepID=UPI001950A2EB|nr:GFA family protein [Microvirga pudoricolor]MBM6595940.1 GFA family protein [Microvirga pudoricolor]